MALPTTDITTTMVKNELGASTNNVSELCTHADVNMWSKRKPVRDTRFSTPIPFEDVGKTQVEAGSGQWGIGLTSYQGDDTITSTYLKPTGGSYPYRLGDFRGYYHTYPMDSEAPISIPPPPLQLPNSNFTLSVIAQEPNANSLTLTDFGLRMGAYVYKNSDGSYIGSATSSVNGGVNINMTFDSQSNTPIAPGTLVDVKFCMASVHKPWSETSGIPGAYEPFRTPGGRVQRNWIGIPVGDTAGAPAITFFNIVHQPDNNRIQIQVNTSSWTGDLFVRITHLDAYGNLVLDDNVNLNIQVTGTVVNFSHTDINWIVPGRQYQAMIWIGNTADGVRDGEAEFTALMPT